jgi:hypothetical protein
MELLSDFEQFLFLNNFVEVVGGLATTLHNQPRIFEKVSHISS